MQTHDKQAFAGAGVHELACVIYCKASIILFTVEITSYIFNKDTAEAVNMQCNDIH